MPVSGEATVYQECHRWVALKILEHCDSVFAFKCWGLKRTDIFLFLLWVNIRIKSNLQSYNHSDLQGVEYRNTPCSFYLLFLVTKSP
jgi:hypothetical protein